MLGRVRLFVTPWTAAHQAPLSMEFSMQEYWNGLPFSPLGDLPDPGIEPVSPASPALAGGFFTAKTPGSYLQGGINSALEGFCKPHGAFLKRNNDSKGVQEAQQGHL